MPDLYDAIRNGKSKAAVEASRKSLEAGAAAPEFIRPMPEESGAAPAGRVVIGTVKGDLREIGRNIVETVRSLPIHAGCLSARLTVTMPAMQTTIEGLRAAGLRDPVKAMVGGAPVSRRFAAQIGAGGYGENAVAAGNHGTTVGGRS